MNPYDRIMTLLRGAKDKIDRLPVFCSARTYNLHAMEVFDAYWPEAHRDPLKMAKLASGLHKLTGNENISVPFDMTVEAEALGAPIDYFYGLVRWPNVKRFTVQHPVDIKYPSEPSASGRIPVICEAIKILKKEFEGKVPIMAILTCPFTSIGSYLVEPAQFFKWLVINPEKVNEFYEQSIPTYAAFANAFKEAGADVIILAEEAASLDNVSPQHFNKIIGPNLTKLIRVIPPPRILHVCGQLVDPQRPNIELLSNLLRCGAEAVTIGETTPMRQAVEIKNKTKPNCLIGGNVSSLEVIHKGPVDRIKEAVKNAIDEGTDMVCSSCDYWLETPTEHIRAFVEYAIEYQNSLER